MKNTVNIEFDALSENQLRQYIDCDRVFGAWGRAQGELHSVRGSMRWRQLRGKNTLLQISPRGAQKVIGRDDAQGQAIFKNFMERKTSVEARYRDLSQALNEQRRMNKALQVGRVPVVVVNILNALREAGLSEHILTVGTHALFAYEAASGVRIRQAAMATQDVDLFFDARQHISFFSKMQKDGQSLIEILKKADPTFEVMQDQKQTAVNSKGFEVDVLRRVARDGDPHPLRMSPKQGGIQNNFQDELWAVQIPTTELIESAQHFDQTVVATTGAMATLRTIDPVSFATLKRKIASDPQRSPLKRPKDLLQAAIVESLVAQFLPQWVPKTTA